ncbi:quinon protein alcohol dehydrogenase-like superfamily [Blyttiomyces helicus]|uniref:Quinon protein alcohol dehydrogenase-like superfamily n=1 Tax=Blyttiomyces helicus TaxID=388810 RepID=A0A4P9WK09_9FUNG|nr:quinon protein alcohol dehydrogenase-like superfamily [Blyttiomyces helicus]|eukprot:RKO91006.1 quinon protein alcohol dehydrogenase-like superfamily [Blyttiomyces helicus]
MIRKIPAHISAVSSIAFDRTGKKVFTASLRQCAMKCFDARTGIPTLKMPIQARREPLIRGPLTRIGDIVIGARSDGSVVACNARSRNPSLALPKLPPAIAALVGSQNLLFCGTPSGDVQTWDISQGVFLPLLRVKAHIDALCASPDNRSLYVAAGSAVSCWETATRELVWRVDLPDPRGVSLSPDGQHLYVVLRRTGLACLDTATGSIVWRESIPCIDADATLSPSGRWLFFPSVTGNGLDWRRVGPEGVSQRTRLLDAHPSRINVMGVSADGTTLCTGGVDGTVVLWSVGELE